MYEKLKNQTVLITGGTGFFGRTLKDYLLSLNEKYDLNLKLILIARGAGQIEKISSPCVQLVLQDVRFPIVNVGEVDYVIHAATPVVTDKSDVHDLFEIIINGTYNVLNFAKENKVKKLINISSGAIYGKQPGEIENIQEGYSDNVLPYDRSNVYGTGKRIAEIMVSEFCSKNNIKYITLRGFAFSGDFLPLDAQFAIGNFVRDAKNNCTIKVNGDGRAVRSYLDSQDLAEWLIQALVSDVSGEVFNLGSDKEIAVGDLAYVVAKIANNMKVEIQNKPNANSKTNRYVPSVQKIKNALGVTQKVSLNESIKKMLKPKIK